MGDSDNTFEITTPQSSPFKHHLIVIQKYNPQPLHALSKTQLKELDNTLTKAQNQIRTESLTDFNMFIQDGKEAGQLGNRHVWHIIGRKEGDFENDNQIYRLINNVCI